MGDERARTQGLVPGHRNSILNLIVVEIARDDVQISFMRYLRVGVPVTLLTLVAGVLVLAR